MLFFLTSLFQILILTYNKPHDIILQGDMMKLNKSILYEITFSILAIIAVSIAILDITNKITLESTSLLYYIDFSILIIFIVDYFIRLYLSDNKKRFVKGNIPDLLAILPFNSMFKAFRFVRFVRIMKISRIVKLTKLTRLVTYSLRVFKRSKRFLRTNGLIYVLYFTLFVILISSVAISYFEDMSFINGIWWSFVTATTVGYGDISPSSLGGRIVASVLMLVGIGAIGMLTGTIATYFLSPVNNMSQADNFEKIILESGELLDSEKKELINYYRFIKSKREDGNDENWNENAKYKEENQS